MDAALDVVAFIWNCWVFVIGIGLTVTVCGLPLWALWWWVGSLWGKHIC